MSNWTWWSHDKEKKREELMNDLDCTSHEIDFFIDNYLLNHQCYPKEVPIDSDDRTILNFIKEQYKAQKQKKRQELKNLIKNWRISNNRLIEQDLLIGDSRKATLFKKDYFFFRCLKGMTIITQKKNANFYNTEHEISKEIIKKIEAIIKKHFHLSGPWSRWEYAQNISDNLKAKNWCKENFELLKELSEICQYIKGKGEQASIINYKQNAMEVISFYRDALWAKGTARILLFYDDFLEKFLIKKQFFVTWNIFHSDEAEIPRKLSNSFKNHFWPFHHKPYKAFADALRGQNNNIFMDRYKLIYEGNNSLKYWFEDLNNHSQTELDQQIDYDYLMNITITSDDVFNSRLNTKSFYVKFAFLFWTKIIEFYKRNTKISLYDLTIVYEKNILKDGKYYMHLSIDAEIPVADEKQNEHTVQLEIKEKQNVIKPEIEILFNSLKKHNQFKDERKMFLFLYLFIMALLGFEYKLNKIAEIAEITDPYSARDKIVTELMIFLKKIKIDYEYDYPDTMNYLYETLRCECAKIFGDGIMENIEICARSNLKVWKNIRRHIYDFLKGNQNRLSI